MADLVGGASTQSRGRRPLPRDAVKAVSLTEHAIGPTELVEFTRRDGSTYRKQLLSWVGGQWGGLWGAGPFPPAVMRELTRWEVQGSYGASAEYRLADVLGEIYAPYINGGEIGVRFFQSGGEACAAAVRIARAATGRNVIYSQGYHGAAIDFAHEPQCAGQEMMLSFVRAFEFGDVDIDEMTTFGACLILETPAIDDEYAESYLRSCSTSSLELGIPFILDEVVTGFRLALGGACERYHVKADMVCLGKAMSAIGGVSALIGRRDLMKSLDEGVFYSTTFGGAPMPCSIAEKTIRFLQREQSGIYAQLASVGRGLKEGLNDLGVKCIGQPERSVLSFPTNEQWFDFCQRMIEHGVMLHRPQFPNLYHAAEDIEMTLRAVEAVLHGR